MNAEKMTIQNSEHKENAESQNIAQAPESDSNTETSSESAHDVLSKLNAALAEPIPENTTIEFISNTAHALVDSMNTKRKNDSELVEQFRSALYAQAAKNVQALEQHLFQKYQKQNVLVDKKLEDLFSCLERIKSSESEIENFKESLRQFYQEMQQI